MELIERLKDKNNTNAYKFLLELEAKSINSNELYKYFDEFLKLIYHKSSFVRTRGFRLCCAQAKWDIDNKIEKHIDELLIMLDDDKPTAVRQCLAALHVVLLYKADLDLTIKSKLETMDLSKYKHSMSPLIKKDILKLQEMM